MARFLSEQQIALELLARLDGDYAATTLLLALLWRSADLGPVRISSRSLAACTHLGHQVVQRALQRLECRSLIRSRKTSRVAGSYAVDMPALRQLLGRPHPEPPFLTGFTPIPALARLGPCEAEAGLPNPPT